MLYPEQNEARLKLSLDGTWAFALGSCVEDQFDPAKPLPDAQPIAVPASYNDQNDQTTALRRHYGWAWYQRKVTLPTFCAGQRVVLRFGSVTHTANVWLNGQLIAQHKGGFTPFEADVTALLHPGETVLLTVACDNRVNHSTLPVGNEDGQLAFFGSDNAGIPSVEAAKRAAAPQNRPNFDFFNYAGIHRPVWLYTTPKEYIEDVTVVPAVDGTVQYAVKTTGSAPVHVMVLDADGNAVASAEGVEGTLTIPEVHLWEPRPGTPYLYTLHITCGADVYDQTFGVRSIEVRGTQVLLNGKPLYFKGFCKHEDFTAHGRGFDPVLNVKDVNLIHWANANAVRTSHYPYAEEFYDLCDSMSRRPVFDEERFREELRRELNSSPLSGNRLNDLGWQRYQTIREAYLGQPWYMRWFCSSKTRMRRAIGDAYAIHEMFCRLVTENCLETERWHFEQREMNKITER